MGQMAGSRRAPQSSADALSPRPVLGGAGGGRQGAASRGDAGARGPGRGGGAQHQGPLEEGHGLDAAGGCGHEIRGASAVFPPNPSEAGKCPPRCGAALPPPQQACGWESAVHRTRPLHPCGLPPAQRLPPPPRLVPPHAPGSQLLSHSATFLSVFPFSLNLQDAS